jgi:hypothetical protein
VTSTQVIVIVAVFLISDGIVVPMVIRGLVEAEWNPIVRAFPASSARPPAPGAVRREFCSLKIGMLSCSWGMHLTADETHLRFEPAMVCRWMGLRPAVVPWSSITYVRDKGRSSAVVRVVKTEVIGPRDIFTLAGPRGRPDAA